MKKCFQQLDGYISVMVDFIMNTNLQSNFLINLQTQKYILFPPFKLEFWLKRVQNKNCDYLKVLNN